MMIYLRSPLSTTLRYFLTGVGLGLFFPLTGTILEIYTAGKILNFANMAVVHLENPFLWVLDTIPLLLGYAFGLAGLRQDKLIELSARLEQRVKESTIEFALANNRLQQDVEMLQQVETVIERGKKEWEAIFDSVSEIIFVVDASGLVARCNRAAVQQLNKKFPEIIGQPLQSLLFPMPVPEETSTSKLAIQSGEIGIPQLGGYFDVFTKTIQLGAGVERAIYSIMAQDLR